MECYDVAAIEEIADYIRQVVEVAFDPLKPQSKGYIRVHVLFDVSKPLRNNKEFELRSGGVVKISFKYERIRKRCFQCQRLTHDKSRCPFNPINRQLVATGVLKGVPETRVPKISEDDPLFGELTDNDVGLDVVITYVSKITVT
ncbi:hypothetical protein V5N11_017608 [Cardamine amara subsp. amara]|uniref:Zinc knuckle CX2CX4HX4C domain-containing protein n=1 Tax=Cardamine amara subsp. amara TaxID=228776 RepID=A0ABD1A0S6_CARAN